MALRDSFKRILSTGLLLISVLPLAACGQIATTDEPVSPTVTAPVENGAKSPVPPGGVVVTPEIQQITLSEDGQTVTLVVGQSFLLNLGDDYNWTVMVDDQNVLSREVNVLVIKGAQGIYKANTGGNTNLTASGDPLCRQSTPPCMSPSRVFHIQVVVNPAIGMVLTIKGAY